MTQSGGLDRLNLTVKTGNGKVYSFERIEIMTGDKDRGDSFLLIE